jgi:hypothetical protein
MEKMNERLKTLEGVKKEEFIEMMKEQEEAYRKVCESDELFRKKYPELRQRSFEDADDSDSESEWETESES